MSRMVKVVPGYRAHVYDKMPYINISDLVHQTNDGRLFWDADEVGRRYWEAVADTVGIEITLGHFQYDEEDVD